MFPLLTFLFGLIFNLFKSKKELLFQIFLHKKEIEILKRQHRKQRLGFQHSDRIIFSILNRIDQIKESISIVKPETVLGWQQQLIEFSDKLKNNVYIIHDNASQFHFNFLHFGLKDIRISVSAPNMNSIAERFVGSVRREALNFFLLLSEKQIRGILTEYIEYYNALRPHQGIDQNIPQGYKPQHSGEVRKIPILGGLCYHYKRQAA